MRAWIKTARGELKETRKLVPGIPLYESMQSALRSFNDNRVELAYENAGIVIRNGKNPKMLDMDEFVTALESIRVGVKYGYEMPQTALLEESDGKFSRKKVAHVVESICGSTLNALRSAANHSDDDAEGVVDAIVARCDKMKKDIDLMLTQMKLGHDKEVETFIESETSSIPYDRQPRPFISSMRKFSAGATGKNFDVTFAFTMLKVLSERVDGDDLALIRGLDSIGHIRMKRFIALDRKMQTGNMKRDNLREMLSISSPKGLEELRSSLAEPTELESGEPVRVNLETPRDPFTRSEKGDITYLRSSYPGLYGIMMRPSQEDLYDRALRNMAKRLIRGGMDPLHIQECLRAGIRNESQIIEMYGNEELDEAPLEPAKKTRWVFVGKERKQETQDERIAQVRTLNDFLGTIGFDAETDAFIRSRGLVPRDVVFTICKGFDFAKAALSGTGGAIGGSHYRGAIIRRNMRRFLDSDYMGRRQEMPEVERLLDFLRSVDLVVKFGSGASTKTKDEAMSIDTGSGHPTGKEIFRTIKEAFHRFKNPSSNRQ